ncbi:MAG: hypothetical protein QOI35_735 [Cryptosporangiaceae bacterium]|jgi:prepilin-type N-terminal cleavage/methylation domain-containing protein|nr:hypothetical protein [Cryptosporangiaceae bacterium]
MLRRACHAVGARLSSRGAGTGGDAGLTLVEVMISIAIIGTVMTSLTMFFSGTMTTTGYENTRQTAVQLAGAAIEKARSMSPTAIVGGRTLADSTAAWNSPATGAAPYLADMTMVYDDGAVPGVPASPPPYWLPAAGTTVTLKNGSSSGPPIDYSEDWYVGRCYLPAAGGACAKAKLAGSVEMLRVVVAINWTSRACAASNCSYVTSTLVSSDSNPTFPAAGS